GGGGLVVGGEVVRGVLAWIACQVPPPVPSPATPSPLASPVRWSPEKRYSGSPFSVTCRRPSARRTFPSVPCTPAPLTSRTDFETTSGGQIRAQDPVHRKCFVVSRVR